MFLNDFAALLENPNALINDGLFEAESESGICKVICYSPNHGLTLTLAELKAIDQLIRMW